MADPISLRRIQADPARDIKARLEAASVEHATAVLAAYELLQELQDHGVLEFLRGLTGAGGDVVTRLSEGAKSPEAVAAMRNIISTLRILGSVDPDILHRLANTVTQNEPPEKRAPGLWMTLRRLGSKESFRAMSAIAYGLQVFGSVLISKQTDKT